ncbi:glucoamylase family protein [Acinetobacter baumannii]
MNTYGGQTYIDFRPLFGHQYSHSWVDFRGISDAKTTALGFDYFENSRRAT